MTEGENERYCELCGFFFPAHTLVNLREHDSLMEVQEYVDEGYTEVCDVCFRATVLKLYNSNSDV